MKDMYSQQQAVIRTLKRKLRDYTEEEHIPPVDRIKELFAHATFEEQRALLPSLKRCLAKKRRTCATKLCHDYALQVGAVYTWNLFTARNPFSGWLHRMYDNVQALWMDRIQYIRIVDLTRGMIRWQFVFVDTTYPNRTRGTHVQLRCNKPLIIAGHMTYQQWQHRDKMFTSPPALGHPLVDCPLFSHGTFARLPSADSFEIITE